MRWCRYRLGLLQKDVAAMVGMEEWLYQDLESGNFRRSFSPEIADKHSLLGDRTENHQPKVFPPFGRKSWARFSVYAAHVRYGNFSPVRSLFVIP